MIRIGHVIDKLREMPDRSVHCVVTSPPYYGLRDYGLEPVIWAPVRYAPMAGLPEMTFPDYADPAMFVGCDHDWGAWVENHDVREGAIAGKTRTTDRAYGDASRRFNGNHQKHAHGQFCRKCGAWRGCLGLEPTPELYIGHMVQVFRELRRVLRPDGTLWLNLGDSYASGNRGTSDADRKPSAHGMPAGPWDPAGIKPKDLFGIPWRAAFALQADGWWLRSDVVWSKTNAMPESVTDRPTRSHEMVFLLTPSERYFYDHVAIREPHAAESVARVARGRAVNHKWSNGPGDQTIANDLSKALHPSGRNKRDVWAISTKPYKGAHFAVMPPDLVEPCILAGTSEAGACPNCGAPWVRIIERAKSDCPASYRGSSFQRGKTAQAREGLSAVGTAPRGEYSVTTGWKPGCSCLARDLRRQDRVPCVVLDPFGGSGTTAMVARNLGRDWEIVEANPQYAALVDGRLGVPPTKLKATKTMRRSRIPHPQMEFFEGERYR